MIQIAKLMQHLEFGSVKNFGSGPVGRGNRLENG